MFKFLTKLFRRTCDCLSVTYRPPVWSSRAGERQPRPLRLPASAALHTDSCGPSSGGNSPPGWRREVEEADRTTLAPSGAREPLPETRQSYREIFTIITTMILISICPAHICITSWWKTVWLILVGGAVLFQSSLYTFIVFICMFN